MNHILKFAFYKLLIYSLILIYDMDESKDKARSTFFKLFGFMLVVQL